MTLEERLEKLAERHEALAQTVEITASMQRANELNIAKSSANIAQLTDALNRLVATVQSLTGVMTDHEHRIKKLEH